MNQQAISSLVTASVLASFAGCAAVTDDDVTAGAAATQALIEPSVVTVRYVDATADALDDWGTDRLIDPALVAAKTLVVRYCAQHFPTGSPALANLTTALAAYSAIPGVGIDITDIAAQPGTATHVDPETLARPANAIYIDYSYQLDNHVFASTSVGSCDSSTPKHCTQGHTYLNGNTIGADTDLFNADKAPSVGVFVHELGHVFGMNHLNEDDDRIELHDAASMGLDRTTVHGHKLQGEDFRGTVIQAATHAFLRAHYPTTSTILQLATDEIVVHHNMSIVDTSVPDAPRHIEFNPSKSYMAWGTGASLIADKNEVKLRWNPGADNGSPIRGAFEPCTAPGTLPRWFARMSETSVRTANTRFQAAFEVSTGGAGFTTVAERGIDSHVGLPGETDFRQIDWEASFAISAADVGVAGGAGITAPVTRVLRFRADSTGVLTERDETNNEWHVHLCLYPGADTTCQDPAVVCPDP